MIDELKVTQGGGRLLGRLREKTCFWVVELVEVVEGFDGKRGRGGC